MTDQGQVSSKINIAGMGLKGGRNDKFYFSLLEYYPKTDRWFLRSLLQVDGEDSEFGNDGNEILKKWIAEYNIKKIVVDFPQSFPPCHSCELECPGALNCPNPDVIEVRKRMNFILQSDKEICETDPKAYERDRNNEDLFDFSKDIFDKATEDYLLTRSFKRKLKKGFIPYWNRSLDFWVWKHYYDALLTLFNISYDSFGNMSIMLLNRIGHLKRHFPKDLILYEGQVPICLVELLRSGLIMKRDLLNLFDMDLNIEARLNIVREIEKNLKIFIYDKDLESIVKNPRAFDSFLLAVIGQRKMLNSVRVLPPWTGPQSTHFLVPTF